MVGKAFGQTITQSDIIIDLQLDRDENTRYASTSFTPIIRGFDNGARSGSQDIINLYIASVDGGQFGRAGFEYLTIDLPSPPMEYYDDDGDNDPDDIVPRLFPITISIDRLHNSVPNHNTTIPITLLPSGPGISNAQQSFNLYVTDTLGDLQSQLQTLIDQRDNQPQPATVDFTELNNRIDALTTQITTLQNQPNNLQSGMNTGGGGQTVIREKDDDSDTEDIVVASLIGTAIGYYISSYYSANNKFTIHAMPTSTNSYQFSFNSKLNKNWSANFTVDKTMKINNDTVDSNLYKLKFEYKF